MIMEWLNLHIAKTLRSPEFIGSSPVERSTWLCVMAWCCEQENGGRIIGARQWKDRQWQQICGVTSREIRSSTRLLSFDGDDLLVNGYPHAKQAEVERGRRRAHAGATARWGQCSSNAQAYAGGNAQASAQADAEGEREGEGEREESAPPSPSSQIPRARARGDGSRRPTATAATRPDGHGGGEPQDGQTPSQALATQVNGFDRQAVADAVSAADPMALLTAYHVDPRYDRAEWIREADGLQVGALCAILAWRRSTGEPIRAPSGLRAARAAFRELPDGLRRNLAGRVAELVGETPQEVA